VLPSGSAKGVTERKIKACLAEGDKRDYKKIALAIVGATVKGVVTRAVTDLVPIAGGVIGAAQHGAAIKSTMEHLEDIIKIFGIQKCTCKCCDKVAEYIIVKKTSKIGRRGYRATIGAISHTNILLTIGEGAKGIYKKAIGTRGVHRKHDACILWIAGKEGCPVAKKIVNVLLGSEPKMASAFGSYAGIIAIAEKLKSK
jgi:hypothetical protein